MNGALGSLALLRDLAPHLVRVYGQDEHQALRRVESHRELLDAVGGLGSTVERDARVAMQRLTARAGRSRSGGRAAGVGRAGASCCASSSTS